MQADEVKILSHLFHRRSWIDIEEIKKAWVFDDFDKAAESLIDKGFITKRGASYCIHANGIRALKKEV